MSTEEPPPSDFADESRLEQLFPDASSLLSMRSTGTAADVNANVALDTNALLVPYDLEQDDLGAISKALQKLASEKRLFVAARSAREFISNRDKILAELVKSLNDANSTIKMPNTKLPALLRGTQPCADVIEAIEQLATAKKNFNKANAKLVDTIKSWRGNDPVSAIYDKVFSSASIVEHDCSLEEARREWAIRRQKNIPPGYKDKNKADNGIGDFLIWKSLLALGSSTKKDLLFVTGEQKGDWFVRAGHQGLYARPELVDEYRRASNGKCVRLLTLADLLRELDVPESTIQDVRSAEREANNQFSGHSTRKPLVLQRTIESGHVRQNFNHGRSKSVVIEKRTVRRVPTGE